MYSSFAVICAETKPSENDALRTEKRKYVVQDSALSGTYERAMERSFGHGAHGFNPTSLEEVVVPDGFPYPIFIAAVTDGRAALFATNTRDQPDRIFEFSPK